MRPGHRAHQADIHHPAVEAGLVRAIDDAEEQGSLPGFAATILRELVRRAPIDWLLEQGGNLQDLMVRAGDLPAWLGDALDELLIRE